MDEYFDLQNYLIKGVESIVADAVKATLRNPKESAFMLRFAAASRAASKSAGGLLIGIEQEKNKSKRIA